MNTASQKAIAIKCLEKLNIYKPYIRKFMSAACLPCFFENFAGFYADQEPELWRKINEVEEEYNCLVYAVTHNIFDFGDCWSMLCISQNPDSIDDFIFDSGIDGQYYVYAYVWNKSNDLFSEFGDIVVRSAHGGIKRII